MGDEVLVGYEAGRLSSPYVVGVAAKGADAVEISDDNGNSIRLTSAGIEITGVATIVLTASTIAVATGSLQVDAAISEFSGVVESSTLVADSVVAASYSPGAGNVW